MPASPEDIARAITLVREGRLVAFPTETVYGLGADAFNATAVEGVFRAKGRPATNPLIVHVVDAAMAKRVCAEWPAAASTLAARFWPGPLTLVLPKADQVPGIVTAEGPTVAVRCPSHPLTLALLETLGSPMVGPSANRSGRISPTCAAHVRESFSEDEVFILDGGPCAGGIESTVLDLTQHPPCVLRPGLLSADEIADTLGTPVTNAPHEPHTDKGAACLPRDTRGLSFPPCNTRGGGFPARDNKHTPHEHDIPTRSPGMHPAHYAPRTPTRLVTPESLARELHTLSHEAFAVVLSPGSIDVDFSRESGNPPHRRIVMPGDPLAYAARLYAALHEADAMAAGVILIVQPWPDKPPAGLWLALADRLQRATSPQ